MIISAQSEQLGEIIFAIIAINCNSTDAASTQHVLAMTWAVNPTVYGCVNGVIRAVIISHVFAEASSIKRHHFMAVLESVMSNWAPAFSHINTVRHRYVM